MEGGSTGGLSRKLVGEFQAFLEALSDELAESSLNDYSKYASGFALDLIEARHGAAGRIEEWVHFDQLLASTEQGVVTAIITNSCRARRSAISYLRCFRDSKTAATASAAHEGRGVKPRAKAGHQVKAKGIGGGLEEELRRYIVKKRGADCSDHSIDTYLGAARAIIFRMLEQQAKGRGKTHWVTTADELIKMVSDTKAFRNASSSSANSVTAARLLKDFVEMLKENEKINGSHGAKQQARGGGSSRLMDDAITSNGGNGGSSSSKEDMEEKTGASSSSYDDDEEEEEKGGASSGGEEEKDGSSSEEEEADLTLPSEKAKKRGSPEVGQ